MWDGLADPLWFLNAVLVTTPVALLALLGWQRRWLSDDGMISLRVVYQLSTGHGMVFNRGERVEASTTALWVLVLWLLHEVSRLPITSLAALAGIVFGTAGLAWATLASVRLQRSWAVPGSRVLWVPLGSLVIVALPPFWDYLTSGLETGLTFGWLGLSWLLVVGVWLRREEGATWRRVVLAALVVGLGPLVRPDAGLYTVGLGLALVLAFGRRWPARLGLFAMCFVPAVIYQVFRMGYFAAIVPNTALAKSAASAQWDWGWVYFGDTFWHYYLWVPLLGLAVAGAGMLRRPGVAALIVPVWCAAVLHATYVVYVGGDFMHARFLLPSIFAVFMTLAALPVPVGAAQQWRRTAGIGVVLVWSLLVGALVRPTLWVEPTQIADERAPFVYLNQPPGWMGESWLSQDPEVRMGRELQRGLEQGDSFFWTTIDGGRSHRDTLTGEGIVVRVIKIGHVAYGGPDVFIADGAALSDPIGARLELDLPPVGIRRAGHNQLVPLVWHLARYAAVEEKEPAELAAARTVVGCGEVAELQHALSDPMTPSRFWENLRSAVRLSALSIPADPIEAERELCDD